MFTSNRASLRVERNQLKSQIRALESNLNRNATNLRKYQADQERINKLKSNLSEIESKITSETEQLAKLKTANINLANSPFLLDMFKTPPKSVSERLKDRDLNRTFGEKSPKSTQTITTVETTRVIDTNPQSFSNIPGVSETINLTSQPLLITTDNSDTVHRLGAAGGTIPKRSLLRDINSKPLTGLFSLKSKVSQTQPSQSPRVVQSHKTPKTFEAPIESLSEDLYSLKPPSFPKRLSTSNFPPEKPFRQSTELTTDSQKFESNLNMAQFQYNLPTQHRATERFPRN